VRTSGTSFVDETLGFETGDGFADAAQCRVFAEDCQYRREVGRLPANKKLPEAIL
jgi:hypothetical protein